MLIGLLLMGMAIHLNICVCIQTKKKLLIAGDQLLPTITSNVGVFQPSLMQIHWKIGWFMLKLKDIVSEDLAVCHPMVGLFLEHARS